MNTAVLIVLLICSTLVIIASLFSMLVNTVIKSSNKKDNDKKGQ